MPSSEGEREEVLIALQRNRPQTISELQESVALSPGAVSAAIRALLQEGLVVMQGDSVTTDIEEAAAVDSGPDTGVEAHVDAPPAPTGALTVGSMLGALPGNMVFRAEVELVPRPDGTVVLGRVLRVLGVEVGG